MTKLNDKLIKISVDNQEKFKITTTTTTSMPLIDSSLSVLLLSTRSENNKPMLVSFEGKLKSDRSFPPNPYVFISIRILGFTGW